jgi:hypothetical protein
MLLLPKEKGNQNSTREQRFLASMWWLTTFAA